MAERIPGFKVHGGGSQRPLLVPDAYEPPVEDDDEDEVGGTPHSPTPPPWPSAAAKASAATIKQSQRPSFSDPVGERLLANADKTIRPLGRLIERKDVVGREAEIEEITANFNAGIHTIAYGPPGEGKTLVASIALDLAIKTGRSPFAPDAKLQRIDAANSHYDERNAISSWSTTITPAIYGNISDRNRSLGLPPDMPSFHFSIFARSHLSVCFIDEIGEAARGNIVRTLTVLEEGVERIVRQGSDSWLTDPRAPPFMVEFWKRGYLPASFVLIGATTRDPRELDPALLSRVEIIRFKPLTKDDRREIARRTAAKIGYPISDDALDIIAELTNNGREANRKVILAAAASRRRRARKIERKDVIRCIAPSKRLGFRA